VQARRDAVVAQLPAGLARELHSVSSVAESRKE